MDHGFDARTFQHREPIVGKGDRVLDLVKIIRQQFVPEIPRRAINGPWAAGLLIKPNAQAPAFLAQIAFACGVHHMGVLGVTLINFGDFIGDEVLMLHRVEGQGKACHRAHLTRPKARGVYDMLSVDRALVGDHIPCPIGAWVGFQHFGVGLDRSPAHPRGLGVGVGGA